MLISTRGRYALRMLLELGRYERGQYVPLPLIARKQDISEKYLEGIIAVLGRGGLVEGMRGKCGGYRLRRELKEYTVGEILRLTEKTLAPVTCLAGGENTCPRAGKCLTLPLWEKLDGMIKDFLNGVTLADLAKEDATKPVPPRGGRSGRAAKSAAKSTGGSATKSAAKSTGKSAAKSTAKSAAKSSAPRPIK